ncbi:MAG TPA: cytochrome C oxidase subunit IV family protein [Baekduia sp.]|nr:cytochrome C oxidase subunit IV family protein [Baekduia sp.]
MSKVLVGVWAVLIAATVASWWLGDDHGLGAGDAAVLAVLAITFVKVWLVGMHFMELRGAPRALRHVFDGYVVVVPVALAWIYLAG